MSNFDEYGRWQGDEYYDTMVVHCVRVEDRVMN